MTCRHAPGDPECSSYPRWKASEDRRLETERLAAIGRRVEDSERELLGRTPNPDDYDILDSREVGRSLVLKVQYSSCEKCSFDSAKVLVFLNCGLKDALRWKRIDPHFSDTDPGDPRQAPSPRARFPADEQGWEDALSYAGYKG